eukprot:3661070-Alexandrium_andersonii.AAC.1
MRLLSNEAKEIDLHSPALNGRNTFTQQLLIAACAGHGAASNGARSAVPSPPHPEPPSDRQARAEDVPTQSPSSSDSRGGGNT